MIKKITLRIAATLLTILIVASPLFAAENTTTAPSRTLPAGAQEFDPGAGSTTGAPEWGNVNGVATTIRSQKTLNAGMFVPDGRGGYIWMGAYNAMQPPNPANEAGREIKLKVRELVDQLVTRNGLQSLNGIIALPSSFVSQDNFRETSSFGRYLAEQIMYEFNQRNIAVREYRIGTELVSIPGDGDFMLTRNAGNITMNSNRAAVIVGTYYSDASNVFVNARLINGVTGMVIRTASLVFPQTSVTRTMLANRAVRLESAYVGMKDFETMTQQTDLSAIDLGEDVH